MSKIIAVIKVPAPTRRDPSFAWAAQNDPERFRTRTVRPDKGHGRKARPRNSNRVQRSQGE